MELEQRSDNRNSRGRSQSLERGLRLLETLGASEGELGVRDLARRMGLASSIVQRLLNSLAEREFIEQEATSRKYRIGPRAFEVGSRFTRPGGIAEVSTPELQRIAKEFQLNSYLGVLRKGEALYLATVQSGPIALRVSPGDRIPLHSTALGKALLLGSSEQEIRDLLGGRPLPQVTRKTKTDIEALLRDMEKSRQRGYALSESENILGIHSVGAPVHDGTGRIIGAISGALPQAFASRQKLAELARVIVSAASRISQRLGAANPQLRNGTHKN